MIAFIHAVSAIAIIVGWSLWWGQRRRADRLRTAYDLSVREQNRLATDSAHRVDDALEQVRTVRAELADARRQTADARFQLDEARAAVVARDRVVADTASVLAANFGRNTPAGRTKALDILNHWSTE